MKERSYICIDLKSFFASVECVDRGLDPFEVNLVVTDASRGSGAICLAVSPAMKNRGVRNRCRVFEIPKDMKYIAALPRMKRYMEVSAEIYSVYLKYISPDDIHVYSIDECFLDVTYYLNRYKKTAKEMAVMLMNAVFEQTGISASAGIGTNLFLAKLALDITAKHAPDRIGILDGEEFRRTLWHHQPITDIWNIGKGIAARLEKYGVRDLHGITLLPQDLLYREFGVNAEYLIDHAYGIEPCTIAEIHAYKAQGMSLSNGQTLFRDYGAMEARVVMREMVDQLTLELVEKHLVTDGISLWVHYSKDVIKATGGTRKLGESTNSFQKLIKRFEELFEQTTKVEYPIRKINIGFQNLEDEAYRTMTLFTDHKAEEEERRLQEAVLSLKKRYGKNAVLKAVSYTEPGTARERNKLIGGHNSG